MFTSVQQEMNQNNLINISGEIYSDYIFSHEVFGEKFYSFYLKVDRLSDNADILPVIISERILVVDDFYIGSLIHINGQIRSHNNYVEDEKRNKLILTIFTRDYMTIEGSDIVNPNDVCLNGYICKPPIYRTTPFGREITDILLAVNRSYNKSDYVPCIAWGRNARFAGKFNVGDNIKISGRMQSRVYQKRNAIGEMDDKVAYEVSVSKIESSADKSAEAIYDDEAKE